MRVAASESIAHPVTPAAEMSLKRVVAAAAVGNFIEWFDFSIYGFFALSIGRAFFPSGDPSVSLLSSLAVYGVAFLVRPLGGLVIGSIGDRHGRRAALSTSLILMGGSTSLIAALPSYATAGILSPICLVLLRSAQGFSAGGEWTGSSAFIVESAPQSRRALFASVISATAGAAIAAAAVAGWLIALSLSPGDVDGWGWRIPFLTAIPLTLAGLYIRLRLQDTPVFRSLEQAGGVERHPIRALGRENLKSVAITFGLSAVAVLGFYYLAAYATTYLLTVGGFGMSAALRVVAVGAVIYALSCVCAGIAADRYGRRPVSRVGGLGLTLFATPAFILMSTGRTTFAVLGFVLFGVFEAMSNVTTTVMLVEMFPARVRASGSAVGFNLAAAVVAGPGPLIAAALATQHPAMPPVYMVVVAGISTAALWRALPETRTSMLLSGSLADEQARS